MLEVREALTRREQRDFLEFPNRLYKGNKYFVPAMYLDERKIFRKDYIYYETCEAVYFNAYRDGCMVGRISGILQKSSNEKHNEKRVRFTRFDAINDFEVAKALFGMVEDWARKKGMDTVCGPLGFSDFEREGLLVEGFDELSTYEEQYNAPYYEDLIRRLGYEKEVEWVEFKITPPEEGGDDIDAMADFVFRRYKLHWGESKNAKDFLDKYADGFFDIVDKAYEGIYGTVPFTDSMKKLMIENFLLIIDNKHAAVILDENDKVICMGVCFPSLAKTMQAHNGHLTPGAIVRYLKTRRHPEIIDFGLIGVEPVWLNRGVSVCIASALLKMLRDPHLKYAETNLNLTDNYAIINLWKRFGNEQHKRRRAYFKKLDD